MGTSRRDVDRERRGVDQGEWDHGLTYLAFVNWSFVICAMCIHVSVVNGTIDIPWLLNAEWIFPV